MSSFQGMMDNELMMKAMIDAIRSMTDEQLDEFNKMIQNERARRADARK